MMRRSLVFLVFAFAVAALPASVSAQKGGGKGGGQCGPSGGMSGPPGMMMKGPPGRMGGPPGMMAGPPGGMMPGRPNMNVPLQNVPNQNIPLQKQPNLLNPLQQKQIALQKNIAVMKVLVPQLRANKIDGPAAKALANDLMRAIQANGANGTPHERETKLLGVMNETLTNLRELAAEPSLTSAHQEAMARIVLEYEQALQTAQGVK